MKRPRIGFVGAGRLAGALAPLLADAGYPLVGVHSRDPSHRGRLARRLPGARSYRDPRRLADAADALLLAVPDRALDSLATALAGSGTAWAGKVVLHHAGSLGPDVLAPLRRRGARCGVLHPLQVMADPRVLRRVAPGTRVRVEGDAAAVRLARRIARDLEMKPIALANLDAAGRSAYHAAASLTANDAAALLGEGARLLAGLGLERRGAIRSLVPLLRGVVEHAAAGDLAPALTGPVTRGDAETLRTHLEVLDGRSPAAAAAHRALAACLLDLVEEHGNVLSLEQRRRLRRLLSRR